MNTLDNKDKWHETRVKEELIGLLEKEILGLIQKRWNRYGRFKKDVKSVLNMEKDPYGVVQEVLEPLKAFILNENKKS